MSTYVEPIRCDAAKLRLGGSLGARDHEHVAARSLSHSSALIDAAQLVLRQHDAMLMEKGLGCSELRAVRRWLSEKGLRNAKIVHVVEGTGPGLDDEVVCDVRGVASRSL